MLAAERERLRQIRSFPSLVKFLRDDLDWPIETEDFDDLTFDYDPEELGIDAQTAAKIENIKQLRPLITDQPWGIFFVKFEPKRLPVVALRRILGKLVIKKRSSANRSDLPAWELHDLLFISSYGEGDQREITFAHFKENGSSGDLPTLRVLGWDGADAALHLDHVHQTLTDKLRWPDDGDDLDAWRDNWSSAFTLRHREVVTTSRHLAIELADLACDIRKRANTVLAVESETGPLRKLMTGFKEALIHDLSEDDFADMYAQTIAYGLLSARVSRPAGLVAENLADMVPNTNPFLKEMMETFIKVGGRRWSKSEGRLIGIDFDELGVNDVVDLLRDAKMEAVLRDFDNRNPEEDPVIHFYESFLKEYDPKKRLQRGVFYTPKPVVMFIVRRVDEMLRSEFGLEDGLADTTTWGEMVERHEGVEIPDGAKPGDSFVQILDPATGTGTFLVEVIDIVHKTMTKKWEAAGHMPLEFSRLWNEYVPKYLLPRLHGYELLMAPYAIAHMKIGLKLYETGYRFGSAERARVYLTNSLEPPQDFSDRLAFAVPALAHEAHAVNGIKRRPRFTVVVGNPPYSQMSQNLGEEQRELVAPYRFVDGIRIVERGAITFERNLQDDYIKFIRLAEIAVAVTGLGVCGLITNHAYLTNITLRGMRQHLFNTFHDLRILDLHGNSKIHERAPDGILDQNVFEIQQGVAISLLLLLPQSVIHKACYAELWGSSANKFDAMLSGADLLSGDTVQPQSPDYYLVPRNYELAAEYGEYSPLTEIFPLYGSAITTARDSIVVDFEAEPIVRRVEMFQDQSLSDAALISTLNISDSAIWTLNDARDALETVTAREHLVPVSYRPFDTRQLFYHDSLVSSPRHPTMSHMRARTSIALAVCRQQGVPGFRHAFVSRILFDEGLVSNRSREKTACFPLYLSNGESSELLVNNAVRVNLAGSVIHKLCGQFALTWKQAKRGSLEQDGSLGPEDVLSYVYAILHSRAYRSRYEAFLKSDFPNIPLAPEFNLFRALGELGGELVALHLMESPKLDDHITTLVGSGELRVEKVSYSDETVWFGKPKTRGVRGVPEEVWTFHIGGYQVCEKWLKDRQAKGGKNPRPGRVLTDEDIDHYQRIVVALNETIRLMGEIDEVIGQHGGWPDAFQTGAD